MLRSMLHRRAFLRTSAFATGTLILNPLTSPPVAAEANDPEAQHELLRRAKKRIPQHRVGAGAILVTGADGKPLANARVEIEQLRHEFLFGCNFFRFGRVQDPAREAAYRERFSNLLNYATLGFYWPYYEPQQGKPIYDYTDAVMAWSREHRLTCKGHPLVWDFADPRWLPREFATISELSHQRVRDIVARYRNQIDIWDVVNEPTHLGRFNTRLGEWAISLGAVPYVAAHLKTARAASPEAFLLVNDYRTDPPFHQILDGLREDKKLLFDGIGIQSHMHGGGWPLRKIWETCDAYADFNVPIHFTETTIVSGPRTENRRWGKTTAAGEEYQAGYVPDFYTLLFAHPSVQAITWWDFSDDAAWQGAPAGLIREDMTPKPVYDRLHELIKKEWWTRSSGVTGADGQFPVSAFYGVHNVKVSLASGQSVTREMTWKRGATNRHTLTL